jgi:hypothetical protein
MRHRQRIGQRDAVQSGPPFLRAARPRALDQNLPHRSGGDADEVALVVPRRTRARQPEVCLVDESCRLQRLTGSFAPHVGGGETAQFL